MLQVAKLLKILHITTFHGDVFLQTHLICFERQQKFINWFIPFGVSTHPVRREHLPHSR